MTLSLKHFDTHTGDWLKDPTKNNQVLSEQWTGTWLEAKFPGVEFSIGHMDETTTEDELIKNHPLCHRLFLATPSGILIYAPEKDLPKIEEVFPDKTHRIAYSSIFKGECKNLIEQSLLKEAQPDYNSESINQYSVLIIDDETGENGGFLPKDIALGLIGDGHGKSSTAIAQATNSEHCMIQFRLGLPELNMQAKGTFAPIPMDELPWNGEEKAELIIPISGFKGNKPKPGLYTTDIWLGEKNRSEKGKIAMSSLIPFYTEGLQDVLPTLDANAKKLVERQNNLTELALLYCERYEQRKEDTLERRKQKDDESSEIQDTEDEEFTDSGIYLAIKAARESGDPSMLHMAPIVKELQDFVARSWKNIAIAKDSDLSWDRVMILPSNKLEQGIVLENVEVGGVNYDRPKGAALRDRLVVSEICDLSYPEGEILLAYRAPVFDKDNVGVFVNKHLPDCQGIDGNPLVGVTAVSSLNWKTVHDRVEQAIKGAIDQHPEFAEIKLQSLNLVLKELNPDLTPLSSTEDLNLSNIKEIANTYDLDIRTLERNYLNQCLDSLKDKGVDLKLIVPVQTVCELQASDFDGDCIAVVQASKFPHLFAETVKQSQSDKCRDPITKFPKELFDPTMSVEQIAIHMYNPPVGLINYSGTTLKSLRSELDLIRQYGSAEDKASYLKEVSEGASKKLYKSKKAIEKGEPDPIAPESRPQLVELAASKNQNFTNLSQDKADHLFDLYSGILRAGISLIDQENQVAVDGMKSSRKPDKDKTDQIRDSVHRPVTVTSQKKQYGIYANKPIDPGSGSSPLELIAANTNVYWGQAKLQPRSLEQFKDLFPEIYTPEQKQQVQKAKSEYDLVFNQATQQAQKERHEEGPFLIASDGKVEIPITNLKDFNHQNAYSRQPLEIKLIFPADHKQGYHQLVAYAAPIGSNSWEPLGTVCEIARENLNLKPEATFTATSVTLHNSTKTSDLLFARAREIALSFHESVPPEERKAMAAAVGHLCTTREDGKPGDQPFKNSRFMFAAFSSEIADYIRNPGITNFLTKVRSDTEIVNVPKNQTVSFQVGVLPNGKNQTLDVLTSDNQSLPFATLLQDSPQLVPGTKVQGQVVSSLNSTLKLQTDLLPGKDLFFGKVDQYDLAESDLELSGQKVKVTLKEEKIKKPTFVLTQDGKVVGTLTNESVEKLEEKNSLTMGRTFEFIAQTTGKNFSTQINLTSLQGNQLKLTGINPTVPRFQGDKVKLTLSERTKEIPLTRVYLEIDGKSYCAGEFTTSANSKASVAILKQAGLFGDGKTFDAKVFSPDPLLQVKIDRDTLDFPEVPPSASCLLPSASTLTSRQQKLLAELKSNPTVFSRTLEPWKLQDGTVKDSTTLVLAVDQLKADKILEDLQNKGAHPIVTDALNPSVREETKRGYVVIGLLEEDVSEALKKKIVKQLGEPIDRTKDDTEYNKRLQHIPKKPGRNIPSPPDPEFVPSEGFIQAMPKVQEKESINSGNTLIIQIGDQTLEIDKLKQYDLGDFNRAELEGKKAEVSFKDITEERSTFVLAYEGQVLGSLAEESVTFLKENDKLNVGNVFKNLTAQTKEEDGILSTTLTSPSGKSLLVIDQNPDVKKFQEEVIAVTLGEQTNKFTVTLAYLDLDGKTYCVGEIEKDLLQKLPSDNLPLEATISSLSSFVPLKPNSVVEPDPAVEPSTTEVVAPSTLTPTQIIAFPVKEDGNTNVDQQLKKWGDKANTGDYSQEDLIQIIGINNTYKGVTNKDLEQLFVERYQPLIDQGISQGSQFLVGDGLIIDKLASSYLQGAGFLCENGIFQPQKSNSIELFPLPVESEIEFSSSRSNNSNCQIFTSAEEALAQHRGGSSQRLTTEFQSPPPEEENNRSQAIPKKLICHPERSEGSHQIEDAKEDFRKRSNNNCQIFTTSEQVEEEMESLSPLAPIISEEISWAEEESPNQPSQLSMPQKLLKKLGNKAKQFFGKEPEEQESELVSSCELTKEQVDRLSSKPLTSLETFLRAELQKTSGVLINSNEPNLHPSLDKFSDEIKFFVNSVNKNFGSEASLEVGHYNDGIRKKMELLTFTFNSQEDRDKAAKELGLVIQENGQISPESKASIGGIEAIEQFIKHEVAKLQQTSPKQKTHKAPAALQVVKPLGDDFSLDDIVDEKDKQIMETIRDFRQQQRTEEVAPIVALELRSDRATHKEGERFILDYDSADKMLSVIDKEINLPVMLAKPIGRDQDNNVIWESLPLPSNSPGLTDETVEVFKELKQILSAEKAEAEKYFNNRGQLER